MLITGEGYKDWKVLLKNQFKQGCQSMIKALIFDFYGVIYSNFNWSAIDERIYSDSSKAEVFTKLKRQANKGYISNEELTAKVGSLAEDDKYPNRPAVKSGPSLNYAVLGLIESIKSDKCKIALLSNGTHEHINNVFAKLGGTDNFFDTVITSSDTQFIKPSKKAFLGAAKRLGTQPNQTLVIDDSPGHVAGALAAGLQAIKFENMEQLRQDLRRMGIIDA